MYTIIHNNIICNSRCILLYTIILYIICSCICTWVSILYGPLKELVHQKQLLLALDGEYPIETQSTWEYIMYVYKYEYIVHGYTYHTLCMCTIHCVCVGIHVPYIVYVWVYMYHTLCMCGYTCTIHCVCVGIQDNQIYFSKPMRLTNFLSNFYQIL